MPQRTEDSLLKHYNDKLAYKSVFNKKVVSLLREHFKFDGTKVLDLGCGDGRLQNFFNFHSYCGVDYSERRINHAISRTPKIIRRKFKRQQNEKQQKESIKFRCDVEFHCCKIQKFLVSDKRQFEICFMFEVLEHLEDPASVIEALPKHTTWLFGSVPLRFTYATHLQVYKDAKDVEKRLGVEVLFSHKKRSFFRKHL